MVNSVPTVCIMPQRNIFAFSFAILFSLVDLHRVDLYNFDGDEPHPSIRDTDRQLPSSYVYSRGGEYLQVYPHNGYHQHPSPPQTPYFRPQVVNDDDRYMYVQFPKQPTSNDRDQLYSGFRQELEKLIETLIEKRYGPQINDFNRPCNTKGRPECKPEVNSQPGADTGPLYKPLLPSATASNNRKVLSEQIPFEDDDIAESTVVTSKVPRNYAELEEMMSNSKFFFQGMTPPGSVNKDQCPEDPSVDVGKSIEWIFETANTDSLINETCRYACEFEKLGILQNNNVQNSGLFKLITALYSDLSQSRVSSYMLRMLQCLYALGNWGDRCNTAGKLLFCGFMKRSRIAGCMRGFTYINGLRQCARESIFEDQFDKPTLNTTNWKATVKISSVEDEEFVVYDTSPENLMFKNGKLVIRPTLLDDETVESTVYLKKCTGYYGSPECYRKADGYNIIPPVKSAQLTATTYFQYGIVEIRAKLPQGDWVVPQIWLEPKDKAFGPLFNSGRVVIGKCYGNENLTTPKGENIGFTDVKTGIVLGADQNIQFELGRVNVPPGWHNKFHDFKLVWDETGMNFYVDEKLVKVIGHDNARPLSERLRFSKEEITSTWPERKQLTPFDQEFRLKIGVSVGGNMEFPDDSVTGQNHKKPWKNRNDVKYLLNFWRDRANWYKTWSPSKTALEVDYVRITALT